MRIILGLVASLALASGASARTLAAWVQVTGTGTEVRAVSAEAKCPSLVLDGKATPLRERAGPNADFGNRVCQLPLPKTAKVAVLEGRKLPLPKARPNRIVVIGDTGCRIDKDQVQNCNDPLGGWPFARVAQLAARAKPDLVIHLGDYYYRERACPPNTIGCEGSPFGDRWPTWKTELFNPGQPLLAASPFVFVRGNHETCSRGGRGWFRMLDADRKVRECRPDVLTQSDPFLVEIGGITLAVIDSADADDNKSQPQLATSFGFDLGALDEATSPVWLLTHRPLWALSHPGLSTLGGDWGNVNLRAGAQAHGLDGVSLILSGHIHNFTSLDFGSGKRPPQLIVGAGGDVMDPRDPHRPRSVELAIDGMATKALTFGEFGYFVLDRKGQGWEGVFRDLDDKPVATCRIALHALKCLPVAKSDG